ncbi:hypothetical protein EUTSA_v10022553mg [Eutrema salsugineum]|uniref:ARID domain-containing protein n=1 Tax=Eutrema salsugineum TaxID=72664 RepID=V4NVC6_EUTSA|nr:AT-rich interactive domain-containing protein 3 [Eutrema salsugineum]XP_006409313.1 AT-rich interactive domain-containing protein 3 [Eutrema salsugineum]ESQ50765.1 hypothetical protein EUTSA_v10022553mg [Eutrema salsugineum]ESQ50766.1 hypothetical protein EUTSA_v10022553mg [Eutrema salsugineum]
MESTMENITEMESERVEQSTNKEVETEEQNQDSVLETNKEIETEEQSQDNVLETNKEIETEERSQDNVLETNKEIEAEEQSQDNVMETENKNPGETVGEEDPVREHKDSPSPMVIEEGTTHASTLEKGNDDDLPKIDDEKNSQLGTSPHRSCSPSAAIDPEEDFIKPTLEDTVEHNIGSSEVSSDILKNDRDSVMVDKDTAVVHEETTTTPNSKLSEDKGSPHHHANTVMEQDKGEEEHDMTSSGDNNEITVNPDTKLSEDKGSPPHHANTVMEQEKVAEEHDVISSGDHNDFPVSTEAKVVEENNDRIEVSEVNNMILTNHGSGQAVDHDIETTTEAEKGPEVAGSEAVSEPENKPSEPLKETSMNVDKEPEIPATENLTDKNSDVLTAGDSGDNDKGLSLLPATQTSLDHNEGLGTLEAEATEDMKVDGPDSKLVTDASFDSTNNKDVNVEAPTNTEKKDDYIVPERNNADNENALVRSESAPPCVASSNLKSEVEGSADLNNGVHKIGEAPPGFDGRVMKRSFLLDDMSDGNESGTEEDQSAFMKELSNFFKEREMEFKPPKFYGEGLNCLKLWRAVTRLGGYDKVTGCKLWRQVGESFRPPKTCTTVSWTFRGFYEKALLEYERQKVMGGELRIPLASEPEAMNIDNQASGSGRARRDAAARAMQGWHSQRLNGNGEVNDPAIKDKNIVLHQKREKQIGTTPGLLKRKRPSSTEHGAKHAIQVSKPMLDVTVVDVGPPADWVKINVQRTQDCFEVYALVPGLVREEVRVQSDPAGRLVISGEPENPMNPWGATPFKKVVSLPTRIDPHHTSAVVTLNGQLFVRVPLEQSD